MGFRAERWRIVPRQLPRVWRYCPDCGTASRFACAERFRTNAQKKTIDVWLKYNCAACAHTWKLPLLERWPVAQVSGELLDAFAHHDRATVWRYGSDPAVLKPHIIRIDEEVAFTIERSPIRHDCDCHYCIRFDVSPVLSVRADKLLAAELCMSRARLQMLLEAGSLRLNAVGERPGDERPGHEQPGDERPGDERPGDERPGDERPAADASGLARLLRRPVRSGQQVCFMSEEAAMTLRPDP